MSAGARLDVCIKALSAACHAFAVYPPSHPHSRQALRDLLQSFRAAVKGNEAVDEEPPGLTVMVVEDDLVVQNRPWHRESPVARGLCKLFLRAGLERVSLAAETSAIELEGVVLALAGRATIESSRHVTISHLELAPGEEGGEGGPAATTLERACDRLLAALRPIGSITDLESEGPQMVKIDRAAWRLTEAALADPRDFLLYATSQQPIEIFWRHGLQTGLHALQLARCLAIEGSMLADIVLSAVLHDIGRLQLSSEQAPGTRIPQWRHTELGAERLADHTKLPPLCALVAYEHHLYWDGSGGFPVPGRRPSLAAQIVSVADAFDVAYQAAFGLPPRQRRTAAAEGLQRQAGLQPDLVAILLEQQS